MKKHKNDIILFMSLIVVALVAYFSFLLFRENGATVTVTVDGKDVAEYSLKEDKEILIGDETKGNTLIIKNGEAYIIDATCPDKICERKKIRYNGESLVCLPNKTVVSISSAEQSSVDF